MARPIHSIRAGRVELAIWENTREPGPPFDVTLSRSYKDGETWKTVHNFSAYDVDNLLKPSPKPRPRPRPDSDPAIHQEEPAPRGLLDSQAGQLLHHH